MAKDPTNEKAKGCPVGGPFFYWEKVRPAHIGAESPKIHYECAFALDKKIG
jgi:hypothetical protein